MSRRPSWSIRQRILVPFLALLTTTAGAAGFIVAQWAASAAEGYYLERGRSIAETLSRASFPLTGTVLRQLKGVGGAEFLLLDEHGRVVVGTLDAMEGQTGPSLGGPAPGLDFVRSWRHDGVAYRVGEIDRTAPEPRRLLILLPETGLAAEVGQARRSVLILTVVGGLLTAVLASWIGRTLSRPLSAILDAIRRIGQGERKVERLGLPLGLADEIGELARGVAQAAERLGDLEQEREETARLRLIRQVSSGLAHEIRNPLTAARMTLQLHIARQKDRDNEPLRIALDELSRVDRQVTRFLKLARPEPPRLVEADAREIVRRSAAGLRAMAEHRTIRLETTIAPDLPAILADSEQVGQVVTNLILNAIEAAGPKGSVVVAVGADDAPGHLAIDVEDDGPGVAPEDRSRLFRPFFTTKPEGVGLGLALCETVLREHGGAIEYHRSAGRTRFRVRLPIARRVAEPEAIPPSAGEPERWPT